MDKNPKIFISYSWSSSEHIAWVRKLAEKLTEDGVIVYIDIWDLKEGHDKYIFIEQMVKSPEIDKVLMIIDKMYVKKANNRRGGVGEETQIISPSIYREANQEKFLPIALEKNKKKEVYLPIYLQSRIYLDFTENNQFKESYEKLLRSIYKNPKFERPRLGAKPDHLNKNNDKRVLIELIHEVVGNDIAKQFLSKPNQFINVMLNSNTIEEFMQFKSKGLISIKPTFNTTTPLGRNNNNSNSIEDRKRPYGTGEGFILSLTFDG